MTYALSITSSTAHFAVRQLPYHIAMAMILTGERMQSVDAERYDLVNQVVPYEDLKVAAQT
jgi:enoyl-CoA hydratase/carnithine racemase